MKISVVVPVYNVEEYIEKCILSIMAQVYEGGIECIVVDDCGADNSMQIAEQLIRNYQGDIVFKTLRHQSNLGLSAARNTGLRNATGDYVMFLDSDDELPKDAIKNLSAPINRIIADVVVGEFEIRGKEISLQSAFPPGTMLHNNEILHSYASHQWPMTACNKLYRLGFIKDNELSFYEGIIHEDELWSLEIASLAQTLYFTGAKTYIYKIHSGSITTQSTLSKKIETFSVIYEVFYTFARCKLAQDSTDVHQILQNLLISILKLAKKDKILFRRTYIKLRKATLDSYWHMMRLNGLKYKRDIRDFHRLLPTSIAAEWEWILIRRL